MNPARVRSVFAKADAALKEGRITREQRDAILIHYYGTANKRAALARSIAPIAIITVLLMAVGMAFLHTGSPTGLVTLDINSTNYTLPSSNNVTISGTLLGDGTASIYLDTPSGTLLVANITSDGGTPYTDKASYAENDMVSIIHAPENATYYFDDGNSSTPVEIPFNASINGTLLIVSNKTYRLPIIIGDAQRTTKFSGLCIETCALNNTNGTLRVVTSGNATLSFSANVGTANHAPALTAAFQPIIVTNATTVNLSEHFSDQDGDRLYFSTGGATNVQTNIVDDILTITPITTGNATLYVYASDLQELVPATMDITVPTTSENSTDNTTLNISTMQNTSNSNATVSSNTTNGTLDCSDADPNKRPLACLQENASKYFNEPDKYWEDLDRNQVAKFNALGNMLITGSLIEQSAGAPGPSDFALGQQDSDGNFVATAWIDTAGNLHLKGHLFEEQLELAPTPGSYSITTRRSIYLMYVDTTTGNLYLRGNLISNRRSLG